MFYFLKLTILSLLLFLSFSVSSQEANTQATTNSKVQLEQAITKYQGEVIYIDFWASWCVPCRRSFPWMNAIQEKYNHQGFRVISINLDVDKNLADKFLIEYPANFSVIYDPKATIAQHFNIQGMPSSMLLGRDGLIKFRHTGFFVNKIVQYEQEIEQLLQIDKIQPNSN